MFDAQLLGHCQSLPNPPAFVKARKQRRRWQMPRVVSKWFLARRHARSYLEGVKTASVQKVPEQWPDILKRNFQWFFAPKPS
jgi:hypothetical protein